MPIPVIAITNASTVLTDDQVKVVIPALQKQVSLDFNAYWQRDATLIFVGKDAALVESWWQIVIVDDPDQAGALGYHELSQQGTPLGKVFARLDLQQGTSWTVTLSHELLEMLADPWINVCAEGPDGRIYAYEVSDAVESDAFGYEIDGILVSDFVTPAWFQPAAGKKVDFKDRIQTPLELGAGGYISVIGPNGWTQLTAQGLNFKSVRQEAAIEKTIPDGSRRQRRSLPRSLWRRSQEHSA